MLTYFVNEDNSDDREPTPQTEQMYVCTEIAAAESIEQLGYEAPKAN